MKTSQIQICDLARQCQAELVIIDTFSRAVEGAENDADTVRNFYRWTAINLKAEGRSLLRIDHAGKDLKKGARGTSAKNDDVDLVWQMVRTGDNIKLTATKKRHTWIQDQHFVVNETTEMFTTDLKGIEQLDKAMDLIRQHNLDYNLSQAKLHALFKVIPNAPSRSSMLLAQAELKRLDTEEGAFTSDLF
jgi:hypothetical protein